MACSRYVCIHSMEGVWPCSRYVCIHSMEGVWPCSRYVCIHSMEGVWPALDTYVCMPTTDNITNWERLKNNTLIMLRH